MTAFTEADREMMARALVLAERGMFTTAPNPRVGCVIARDGLIIGEGWHERTGEAHAEARALENAKARGLDARGATAYVTLEPCNHAGHTPPCTEALIAAGVARVVAAMADPNPDAAHGAERLRAAAIVVDIGLCADQANELNRGFVSRMERGRPWVRLKAAASLDGRTALSNGVSQWITGEAAREDGHRWRARACAVLTGIGTVLSDDPQLTVRAIATPRQPRRIVIDRHAQTPASARVLVDRGAIIVTAGARNPAWPAEVEVLYLPDEKGRIDLEALLRELGMHEMNEVHVEAGARLNGALLSAGLVDEVLLYLAPMLLGDPARGIVDIPGGLSRLADAARLVIHSVDRIGSDIRIVARMCREET